MQPLAGKSAIVTGASAPMGIGRAIAVRLAQDGAQVIVTDIAGQLETAQGPRSKTELLAALADEITQGGGQAIWTELDVTSQEAVTACVDRAMAQFGSVDILVNNAGSLAGSRDFMTTTPQEWQSSFEVNLLGPMMMAQAVIPHMQRSGGGRIINIGSTGSLGAEPGFGAYTAMKHGLTGLSKTLAVEFGPDGILCNTVCPGYIATDMHQAANQRLAAEHGTDIDTVKAQRYRSVALRRAGLPGEVANAVAFLAGAQGDYVTGINLPVTGGVPPGI